MEEWKYSKQCGLNAKTLYFHTSARRGISTARGRTISTLKWKNPRRIELDVATLLFSHAYAEFLFVFDEKHIGLVAAPAIIRSAASRFSTTSTRKVVGTPVCL